MPERYIIAQKGFDQPILEVGQVHGIRHYHEFKSVFTFK